MARKKKDIELSTAPGSYKMTGGDVSFGISVSKPALTEQPRGMETPEEQKAQPGQQNCVLNRALNFKVLTGILRPIKKLNVHAGPIGGSN